MSRFTKVKTQISDLDALCDALDELGVEYDYDPNGGLSFHAYTHTEKGASVVIRRGTQTLDDGTRLDIEYEDTAFRVQDNGEIEVWHSVHSTSNFPNRMKQEYAVKMIERAALTTGQVVGDREVMQDGTIKVHLIRPGLSGGTEASVNPEGVVEAEGMGIKGKACSPTVGAIQQVIGGAVIEDTNKPEFYEPPDDPGQGVSMGSGY